MVSSDRERGVSVSGRGVRPFVTAEQFVKVWQKAKSAIAAAKAMGMDYGNARVRAAQMRKRGIPLKMFGRGRKPMNVRALSKIAREAGK